MPADTDNYEILNKWATTSGVVSTPKDWFKDHFAHPAIWTFLSKLDIPVGCFQGLEDPFASAEGVKRMEEQAKKAGKSNMHFYYFEHLEHSLGILRYFVKGTLPDGHKKIFEFIDDQVKSRRRGPADRISREPV